MLGAVTSSQKLLAQQQPEPPLIHFVSDYIWGSSERMLVSRCVAVFLEKAWDV
jgi:hypothetical protein